MMNTTMSEMSKASDARSWQQMMQARLGIDKTKAWADWAEEEEEADAMILTLEAATEPRCMVNTPPAIDAQLVGRTVCPPTVSEAVPVAL